MISAMGAVVLILAVLTAILAYGYASNSGWTGSKGF